VDYKSGVEGAAIAQLPGNLLSEWAEAHEKTGQNRRKRNLFSPKVMDQGANAALVRLLRSLHALACFHSIEAQEFTREF
jgi:hypothetical protein